MGSPDRSAAQTQRRPWFDYTTDVRPRLDRFRDPWHWLIDSLPWFLRRFYLSMQYREWVPNGARYIGTRRPPWEAFDIGRKLHGLYDGGQNVAPADIERGEELAKEHGWLDVVADRVLREHGETLRKLAEDD